LNDTARAEAAAYLRLSHAAREAYPHGLRRRPDATGRDDVAPTPEPYTVALHPTDAPSRVGEVLIWHLAALGNGRGGVDFLEDKLYGALAQTGDSLENLASTDPAAAAQEMREILLDFRNERERVGHSAPRAIDPATIRQTAFSRTARVERDEVRAIAGKLDSDPRIFFNILQWASWKETASLVDRPHWYVAVCVEHNLDPVTGARLPKWKGKVECIQRLHEVGIPWARLDNIDDSFGAYKAFKAEGTRAFLFAKDETLHNAELRRLIWVIDPAIEPDPDFQALAHPDAEVLSALIAQLPRDLGLRA